MLNRLLTACLCLAAASPAIAESRPGAIADLRIARGNKGIAEAWLADSTKRYRHFVLGAPYEAASLMVKLASGKQLKLTLDETSVFEDRQPRLADLDGDGRDEIIVVRSRQGRGAALAVVGVAAGRLQIIAETPPTGRQNTWLNPAGIADFNGDGRLDVAYVQMPHVLGRLRVWTLRNGKLHEIAQLENTSNHVIGSTQLGLSAVADFDGDGIADLAVPTLDRKSLRFISFVGKAREIALKPLPGPAVADFRLERHSGKPTVVVGLGRGKTAVVAP